MNHRDPEDEMSKSPDTAEPISDVDPESAMRRIRPWVRRTPTIETGPGAFGLSEPITLKLECMQHAGSFKTRGGFNSSLASEIPEAGLIAASGGNHGLAVAFVAKALGLNAEIFVPKASSAVKVQMIRDLGATVHVVGALYDDARLACNQRAAVSGALDIHPYDAVPTISGQATVGLELAEQVPDLDTVIVAVGGGGLVAGITAALPPAVKVVGVEPHGSACLHAALAAGQRVDVEIESVAADSLGALRIGEIPWSIIKERVESLVVNDDAIIAARRMLWAQSRVAVEHGGATAMAALTSGAYVPSRGEKVVVVVCGSNTDPGDLIDRT